jgi:hypothetical protein
MRLDPVFVLLITVGELFIILVLYVACWVHAIIVDLEHI